LTTAELIYQSITSLANPTELAWIEEKRDADAKGLALAFVMVPRKVSKTPIQKDLGLLTGWNWQHGTVDDTAEMNELVALYRALPALIKPEIWLHRATDAVRSNMGPVFDAIAFGNPYPKTYFSELAWNQLVLKCIFNDKPIHLIEGLDERANQALADTLADFAQERWSAGRRVPSQVWRLIREFDTKSKKQDLERLAASPDPNDQIAAQLVLNYSPLEAWKVLEKEETAY
jgi:hypothetical protein